MLLLVRVHSSFSDVIHTGTLTTSPDQMVKKLDLNPLLLEAVEFIVIDRNTVKEQLNFG